MNKPPSVRIDSLPQWARHYIASLERQIEARQRLIVDIERGGSDAPSAFSWSDVRGLGRRFYLPESASLSMLANSRPHALDLDCQPDGRLRIMMRNAHEIAVFPQADNVVTVGPRHPNLSPLR